MTPTQSKDNLYDKILNHRFSDAKYAYSLCIQLEEIGLAQKDYYACAFSKIYMTDTFITRNQLQNALICGKEALTIIKEHHIDSLLSQAYNLIGIIFYIEHDDLTAFTYHLKGLDAAISANDLHGQSLLYTNIGSSFSDYHSTLGLDLLLKAESINHSLPGDVKDSETLQYNKEVLVSSIAISYVNAGQYEEALHKLLELGADSVPTFVQIPFLYVKIVCYHKLNQLKQACELCQQTITFLQHDNNISEDFVLLSQIIKETFSMDLYEEAKQMLDLICKQIIAQNNPVDHCILYQLYITYYQKVDHLDMLMHYYQLYFQAHLEKDAKLQTDYITAIENKIALDQALDLEKHYQEDTKELELKSRKDALTELGNRYGLEAFYKEYFPLCCHDQKNFCIMIIDIDYFKIFNDTQGHLAGDSCIKRIASLIQAAFPSPFYAARYGGDEFFVVSHTISFTAIQKAIDNLFTSIKEAALAYHDARQQVAYVTISLGGICTIPNKNNIVSQFITAADTALYRVKEDHRNGYLLLDSFS